MNSKTWGATTSSGNIHPGYYKNHLLSGFKPGWGYSSNNIVLRNIEQDPSYSFTVFAFKEINENLYIGVRANTNSGSWNKLKILNWNNWDNVYDLVYKIVYTFLTELGYKI
jgi:hypothetical protein